MIKRIVRAAVGCVLGAVGVAIAAGVVATGVMLWLRLGVLCLRWIWAPLLGGSWT